jgi:hypothetical protein
MVHERCPLRDDPDLTHLLVSPGNRSDGLRELRDFTADISKLTVLDPYFFSGDARLAPDIADEFVRTARAGQGHLKAVHVVRDAKRDTKAVFTGIKRALVKSGVRLTYSSSSELHDRVWIGDGKRAVAVGTSFGGLGTRAAFILELPAPDLKGILEFLHGRGLAPRSLRRAVR